MSILLGFIVLLFFSSCSAKITAAYDDEKCQKQGVKLDKVDATSFIKEFKFDNETRTSVLLSWSPSEKETIILVTTQGVGGSSEIYKSKNAGEHFVSITSQFNDGKIAVLKGIGLQRNPHSPNHVLIISRENNQHVLWVSQDGGEKWKKVTPPFKGFKETDTIKFYDRKPQWGLTTSADNSLFGTQDGGISWKLLQKNAAKYMWSSHEKDKLGSIYVMTRVESFGILSRLLENARQTHGVGVSKDLHKIDGYGSKPKKIFTNIWQFSAHGKFLYVSEQSPKNEFTRHMKVSTDGGHEFHEVQLPSITADRFYAIMDMSEDLIFMHVDNPGDTGHGTLYTSGSDGIIFSQSLNNHLYPNYLSISDFYRVQSMRGTYLTTQMNGDNSMHTVITFNRGAEWQPLSQPLNVKTCPAKLKSCNLQVSSLYSKMNIKRIPTHLPLSSKSAPGIIMLHGHTHSSLQTSAPDVHVTSDGGHSWIKALTGVHRYQIADHGGLLIAVADNAQNVVKFSTDEGRCWHHYTFTESDFRITGLLTEPNNKIMKVLIWGFGIKNFKWRIYAIDFAKIIPRQCSKSDYEEWVPHADMSHPSGAQWNGCLLGAKEKFSRLKKDSWCSNGVAFAITKTVTPCPCTKDDYECEYGYSRPINSFNCAKDSNIVALDACIGGNLEKIITTGYRRLPGDKCQGGFKPDPSKQVALHKKCGKDDKGIALGGLKPVPNKSPVDAKAFAERKGEGKSGQAQLDKSKIVWIVAGVCLGLIICVLVAVMVSRYRQMRQRDVSLKFSLLNDAHEGDFSAAVDADLLDPGQSSQPLSAEHIVRNGGPRAAAVQGKTNPVLRSYHDDSDVDLIE